MRYHFRITWPGLVIGVAAVLALTVLTVAAVCVCVLMVNGTVQVVQR